MQDESLWQERHLITCISETLETKLIKACLCETEIIDCLQVIRSMHIKREKKTTHVRIGEEDIHHQR